MQRGNGVVAKEADEGGKKKIFFLQNGYQEARDWKLRRQLRHGLSAKCQKPVEKLHTDGIGWKTRGSHTGIKLQG